MKGSHVMKLEWMGAYRNIVGDFYRSANGYSQICKMELFGDSVRFSPYEVQIMEHILEYGDQHKNMKWYAEQLGLSQATHSKYVQRLVNKGLLEKYHKAGNRKDIILMVSPLGLEEYKRYSEYAKKTLFSEFFDVLDSISQEELGKVEKLFNILGRWHRENFEEPQPPVSLVPVER
jgi:DNA-binding MarR family transcriptional regulator